MKLSVLSTDGVCGCPLGSWRRIWKLPIRVLEMRKPRAMPRPSAGRRHHLGAQSRRGGRSGGSRGEGTWAERVKYAKDVDVHAEYALYEVALKSQPATTVDLPAALEAQNPKSKYLDLGYAQRSLCAEPIGDGRIRGLRERGWPVSRRIPICCVMVNYCYSSSDRAQNYANRVSPQLANEPSREGVADGDWERQKSSSMGRATGFRAWSPARRTRCRRDRAALPYIKGNDATTAPAPFYLGVANYNLGKMTMNKAKVLEGAKFSDQCAAIPGCVAGWKNSAIMKADAGKYAVVLLFFRAHRQFSSTIEEFLRMCLSAASSGCLLHGKPRAGFFGSPELHDLILRAACTHGRGGAADFLQVSAVHEIDL